MKISKISVTTMILLTGAFLATSCATDVETEINTDPKGNAISFSPSVGPTSRATPIDISNLGDFAVMARGMHPDGVLYNAYLIGSEKGGEIAKYLSVTGSSGIWTLTRNVYWPADISRALFIGYTTLKRDDDNNSENSDNGVLGDAKFEIPTGTGKPTIKSFAPKKASLADNAGDDGKWTDGKDQKDLLVAFTAQDRGPSTTVNLNFRHALTQVSITAKRKDKADNDHRIVKIKGAWLVNAAKSGELSATIAVDESTSGFPVTNKTSWYPSKELETYGSYYNDGIPLTKGDDKELLRESLMLIPQNLTAWDGTSETTTGAYLMLLCRVELEHEGTSHPGSTTDDIAIFNGSHYHQLFPVNPENSTKYDGSEYGFVCMPLSTDWGTEMKEDNNDKDKDPKGMGKHYTYRLDICGQNSGAGVYPPIPQDDADALVQKLIPSGAIETALVLKEDNKGYEYKNVPLKVVTKRPTNKKVGDPVLDEPIKFSVTVKDWDDESEDVEWKPGTGTTPTDE